MPTALIEISTPKGAPYEFLVVFAVLLLGPVLFRRAGIPGIIGLLVGGYAIGPHGLSLIGSGNNTLPDLGQLGLLYLMFVAGVEIDLNLLLKYRRPAVTFGLLTFILPFILGTTVGIALGWEALAAILLGSLLASHTLITYPAIKEAGLAADPAVASAVGSTVLTDTLALVVLAVVAGVIYLTVEAKSLPSFMGQIHGDHAHRSLRGIVALIVGVLLVAGGAGLMAYRPSRSGLSS